MTDVSELQRSSMPKFRVEGLETSEPLKFKFFRVFYHSEKSQLYSLCSQKECDVIICRPS